MRELFCFRASPAHAINRNERRLALILILADGLAGFLRRARDIEQIVRDLEDEPEVARIVAHALAVGLRAFAEDRAGLARELEQLTGLQPLEQLDVVGTESALRRL